MAKLLVCLICLYFYIVHAKCEETVTSGKCNYSVYMETEDITPHSILPVYVTIYSGFKISLNETKYCSIDIINIENDIRNVSGNNQTNNVVDLKINVTSGGNYDIRFKRIKDRLKLNVLWIVSVANDPLSTAVLYLDNMHYNLVGKPNPIHSISTAPSVLLKTGEDYNASCTAIRSLVKWEYSSFEDICNNVAMPRLQLFEYQGLRFGQNFTASALVKRFPSVLVVKLSGVSLTGDLVFPWAQDVIYDDREFSPIGFRLRNGNFESLVIKGVVNFVYLVNISVNSLNDLKFRNATVTLLAISEVRNVTLDENIFHNLSHVDQLILTNNDIQEIPQNVFIWRELKYLDLSNNKLQTLQRNVFKDLTSLKMLDLSDNMLQDVKYVFHPLRSIQNLILRNNTALQYIPLDPFYGQQLINLDLSYTSVTYEMFNNFITQLDLKNFTSQRIKNALGGSREGPYSTIVLDVSNCNITSFDLYIPPSTFEKITHFLSFCNIVFRGNPISCNCFDQELRSIFVCSVHHFTSKCDFMPVCQYPLSMRGKPLSSISDSDMYCEVTEFKSLNYTCPQHCTCYSRYLRKPQSFIIDCQNKQTMELPVRMKESFQHFELWMRNSSLQRLDKRGYFKKVITLDVSENGLTAVHPEVIDNLSSLSIFKLHSNKLKYLPYNIQFMKVSEITLRSNNLRCDCKSKWLKDWMLSNEGVVSDWTEVTCVDIYDNVRQLISVHDDDFGCTQLPLGVLHHVYFLAIVIGSICFVLLAICLLVFFGRRHLKILLYIYCGAHPFDTEDDIDAKHDVVLLCSPENKTKMDRHLSEVLTSKGYKIADLFNHAILGTTFCKSVTALLRQSRRAVIYINGSEHEEYAPILQYALQETYAHAKRTNLNFLVLTRSEPISPQIIRQYDFVRKFEKTGRVLCTDSRMFKAQLLYAMPKLRSIHDDQNDLRVISYKEQDWLLAKLLTSYCHSDEEFIKDQIIDKLKAQCHDVSVCLLDDQIAAGTDIRDDIDDVLRMSTHFLAFLSTNTLNDEKEMYILTQTVTHAMTRRDNFLLLCTLGNPDLGDRYICRYLSEDVRNFMRDYATVDSNDPNMIEKICNALEHGKSIREDHDMNITVMHSRERNQEVVVEDGISILDDTDTLL